MDRERLDEIFDDPVTRELLGSNTLMRLAYTGRDGAPRVIPIGWRFHDGVFLVHTLPHASKVRALQEDPRVAITIDTHTNPPLCLLVRGTADVEVVDGVPEEYLNATSTVPPEEREAFARSVRELYDDMARITITPTWAKLIDFERTLPEAVEEQIRRKQAQQG